MLVALRWVLTTQQQTQRTFSYMPFYIWSAKSDEPPASHFASRGSLYTGSCRLASCEPPYQVGFLCPQTGPPAGTDGAESISVNGFWSTSSMFTGNDVWDEMALFSRNMPSFRLSTVAPLGVFRSGKVPAGAMVVEFRPTEAREVASMLGFGKSSVARRLCSYIPGKGQLSISTYSYTRHQHPHDMPLAEEVCIQGIRSLSKLTFCFLQRGRIFRHIKRNWRPAPASRAHGTERNPQVSGFYPQRTLARAHQASR